MFAYRLVGLFLIAGFLAVAAVSAQPALPKGVKVQPAVKPNVPAVPNVPKGGVPDGKNLGIPAVPPGVNPGIPVLPGTPGLPVSPQPKLDNIKWPTELNGKTLEIIVREMRTHSDPAVREAAVRTLPAFGPKSRELGGNDLIDAMTKELDWNVRLAALSVGPTVILGFAKAPDELLNRGLGTIVNYLTHEYMQVRFDVIGIVGSIGPFIRINQPSVVQKLSVRAREAGSWQMRRAAIVALGNVGLGKQTGDTPDLRDPPDAQSVTALLDILRLDQCAAVRREAVNSLISLGPVAPVQQKTWKSSLDNLFKLNIEKDKSVLLWARVLILRNGPDGLKGNEVHLDAIAQMLGVAAPASRLEACAALAVLGEDAKSKLGNVIDIINNAKEEPEVVIAAITAAASIPSKSAVVVPILVNVKAMHKNEEVKRVATEAIDYLTMGKKKN